ncbi:MAG: glycerate kinase [Anaerolineae bacterium]|nr:glycerate kinase [Anaerolineae bacterium]
MSHFDPALFKNNPSRELAFSVLDAALDAADPVKAVKRHVQFDGSMLRTGDRTYDLAQHEHLYVVGGGKAGAAMASAVEDILGDRITAGVINVKYGYTNPTRYIEINEAGHPIPDEAGVNGARRMLDLARAAGARDLVLCLISGGGSALMTAPAAGVTLADMQQLTEALLRSGATINEINAIRKHLSQIKGGHLAHLAYPATVVSLILSDVVGSPLDVIASGPTVPDGATFADARAIIARYGIAGDIPASITAHLARAEVETPKAGDPVFERVQNQIIAGNDIAAQAALEQACFLGFNSMILSTYVEGEAREVAKVFAAVAREILVCQRPLRRPACLIAGGETTVTLHGAGRGGRNQEMALAAAPRLDGLGEDVMVIALATDGTDGPTDAAGGIADGTTLTRARAAGLDLWAHLANNDSYHFLQRLGDLIVTGPTNTNVNDLIFVFVL